MEIKQNVSIKYKKDLPEKLIEEIINDINDVFEITDKQYLGRLAANTGGELSDIIILIHCVNDLIENPIVYDLLKTLSINIWNKLKKSIFQTSSSSKKSSFVKNKFRLSYIIENGRTFDLEMEGNISVEEFKKSIDNIFSQSQIK